MTPFSRRQDGSGIRDWAGEVVAGALEDAGMSIDDIDAVVVASESDFLSLQVSLAAVLVDDLALLPRPVMRVEAGGATGAMAVRCGVQQILSGLHDTVLVLGVEHAASHLPADQVRAIYGLSFDADLEGFTGVTATALYALSMQHHMARYRTTAAQMAAVSVKNHRNACFNPDAHKPMNITVEDVLGSPVVSSPYRLLDCSLISDGAAAVILSSRAKMGDSNRPAVRIVGSGCASDASRIGERTHVGNFEGKAHAAQQAYRQAGVKRAEHEVAFAEVYDAYTGAEIQAIEALQLGTAGQVAPALAAGAFHPGQPLAVNLSGGLIGQGGPPGATGVAQIHTLLRLLQGRYHPQLQQSTDRRFALSDAHGGVATVSVVHVLERVDD
jgi:acetyl-CoA C-acetyltransferase